MLIEVDDRCDERLRDFAGLRDAQLRRDEDRFIAEGLKIIGFADRPEGAFIGELTDPDAVVAGPDGLLRIVA